MQNTHVDERPFRVRKDNKTTPGFSINIDFPGLGPQIARQRQRSPAHYGSTDIDIDRIFDKVLTEEGEKRFRERMERPLEEIFQDFVKTLPKLAVDFIKSKITATALALIGIGLLAAAGDLLGLYEIGRGVFWGIAVGEIYGDLTMSALVFAAARPIGWAGLKTAQGIGNALMKAGYERGLVRYNPKKVLSRVPIQVDLSRRTRPSNATPYSKKYVFI